MIAAVRPHAWDFPLFLHVFGAIVLFGTVLAAAGLSFAAPRRPDMRALPQSAFWTLLAGGVPAWVAMRGGGEWIRSKEGFSSDNGPDWLDVGYIVADIGLLVLLLTLGFAFWWKRSNKPVAARVVAGLTVLYILMLAVAWLAMSGKWGS